MVQNDEDEIDKLNNNPNPNDEETGLTQARLSSTTDVSSTEQRINEIQDDGDSDGEI